MDWQARANPIFLGLHFFVTQNAILTARFLRQIKTRTKMSRFMTRKMLLIHAADVSARLARILLGCPERNLTMSDTDNKKCCVKSLLPVAKSPICNPALIQG